MLFYTQNSTKNLRQNWTKSDTVQGRLMLNIFGSLAEFERDTISVNASNWGFRQSKQGGRMGGKRRD